MKKLLCFFCLIILSCLLTGCGNTAIKRTVDGTTIKIEGERTGVLSRLPYFENKEDRMVMTKNGDNWYSAAILSKEEYQTEFEGHIPMAESSNILVYKYRHEHPDFLGVIGYRYIMKLEGTDEAVICFDTDTPPDEGSYGNDFKTCIHYYAGKTETIPDTDFILK